MALVGRGRIEGIRILAVLALFAGSFHSCAGGRGLFAEERHGDEFEAHLAGVNVFLLQVRKDVVVEVRTERAARVGPFGDDDGSVNIANSGGVVCVPANPFAFLAGCGGFSAFR